MFAFLMLVSIQLLPKVLGNLTTVVPGIRVAVFCDDSTHSECAKAHDLMTTVGFASGDCHYSLRGFLVQRTRILLQDLASLASELNTKADFVLAVGEASTIHTLSIVTRTLGIPLLGYIASGYKDSILYTKPYISLNADAHTEGTVLSHVIGQYNMPQTVVLIEDKYRNDGFIEGFEILGQGSDLGRFKTTSISKDINDISLERLLTELSIAGWKIILIHCDPLLMKTIVKGALKMRLFGAGYAWFLSEKAWTKSDDTVQTLPQGLLAFRSFSLKGISGVILKALDAISNTCLCQLTSMEQRFTDANSLDSNLTNLTECVKISPETFRQDDFIRNLKHPPACVNASSFHTISPSDLAENRDTGFHLLNLIDSDTNGKSWDRVGFITATGKSSLKTVLWPGNSLYGPSSNIERTYRVVTRPAKPFVFINGPVDHPSECFSDFPCIQMFNNSPNAIATVIETFLTTKGINQTDYLVHCCKGMSLELLDKVANDLNFEYVIYFMNDTDYGTYNRGTWTGMVGDIASGAADLVVGAFSITSERLGAISFTEPYFQNAFAMVTSADGRSTSIWAFLSPFSLEVWICIIMSSIVAGIATSVLEWYSPFGLNPRGRRRDKNYGLGSGLLMVWVLVTGHTINVKAPKSWPSKVIQNVWAGLAIFIMTSYTANLAAYLAGQSAVVMIRSIFDSKLLSKKVSLIKSSAVESFLAKINPDLSHHVKTHYTHSTEDAILKLRKKEIDVYLDDSPLLEFAVSRLDKDCSVRFVGKGFGSDGYAFGVQRFSWLQVPLSNRIMAYTESGYIQDLSRKYLTRPKCDGLLANSAVQYSLEHTGGLFIILSSTLIVTVLLVCGEHAAYKYIVPWIREKPAFSWWKSENLAFLSQRLYRVVRSEKLYSQKHAAQEMMKIVRDRDFTRLIQKHELQKRKAHRKKEKTKTEVFQEITANIVSFHRQLKTAQDDQSGPEHDAVTIDMGDIEVDIHCANQMIDNSGLSNPGYNTDDGDLRKKQNEVTDEGEDTEVEEETVVEEENEQDKGKDDATNENDIKPFDRRLMKFYSTWPSPQQETVDPGTVSQDSAVNSGTSSDGSPVSRNNDIWVISDGCIKDPDRTLSPLRKFSDLGPFRPPTPDMQNNVKRSMSHDSQSGDYFQRNLRLKDNRVKSTLRRHALSGYQSHLPVEFLDECTIEALSKEDLLVLWKKSEIELQSRLNEVLTRNKSMSMAIDYLLRCQTDEIGEEV